MFDVCQDEIFVFWLVCGLDFVSGVSGEWPSVMWMLVVQCLSADHSIDFPADHTSVTLLRQET